MSTITPQRTPVTSTSSHPSRRPLTLTVSAIVVIAAAIALTVWLLVRSPAHHAKVTTPPHTNISNIQKPGVAGQVADPNAVNQCLPAPSARFC